MRWFPFKWPHLTSHTQIVQIYYCYKLLSLYVSSAQWTWNLLHNGYKVQNQQHTHTHTSCIKLPAQSCQILFFMGKILIECLILFFFYMGLVSFDFHFSFFSSLVLPFFAILPIFSHSSHAFTIQCTFARKQALFWEWNHQLPSTKLCIYTI